MNNKLLMHNVIWRNLFDGQSQEEIKCSHELSNILLIDIFYLYKKKVFGPLRNEMETFH
jgi:hypothetical protein